MKVTCIDVGSTRLAIILAEVYLQPQFAIKKILRHDLVNLYAVRDKRCKKHLCDQHGSNDYSHLCKHFFHEFEQKYFKYTNLILIERQPATRLTAIEQIINFKYPEKTKLMSPMTLSSYLGSIGIPRPQKKLKSFQNAIHWLTTCNIHEELSVEAHHDICDVINYVLLYLKQKKEQYEMDLNSNVFSNFMYRT